jgi:hypothetical protein
VNHNLKRFAQLTGSSQVEFKQAWDELVRYATNKASQYFDDGVSLDEAVDEVMISVTDWLIQIHNNPGFLDTIKAPWGYIKKFIYNHLKKLSKDRDSRPSYLESASCDSEDDSPDEEISASSYRVFTPVEKPIKSKDSIIVLYAYGESKDEIVKDCGVSKRYVNMVIHENSNEIAALKNLGTN